MYAALLHRSDTVPGRAFPKRILDLSDRWASLDKESDLDSHPVKPLLQIHWNTPISRQPVESTKEACDEGQYHKKHHQPDNQSRTAGPVRAAEHAQFSSELGNRRKP
jgi:hypothetical protein